MVIKMLDDETKELVAICASLAANCQPCLGFHLKASLKSGITKGEIKEVMEIARNIKLCATANMDEAAKDFLECQSEGKTVAKIKEGNSPCCG